MACKPELGMTKVLAREGYFIRGSSEKMVAKELHSRLSGNEWAWELLVGKAVRDGLLIKEDLNGESGHRTLTALEQAARAGSLSSNNSVQMASVR